MTAEPVVVVEADAVLLAEKVAGRTLSALITAIEQRGEAHLVVTGGDVLEAVLGELGSQPGALDWGQVHFWWGDERWVADDSDDRNDAPARAKLIDRIAADPAKVHAMPSTDSGFMTAEVAADAYAAELAAAADGAAVPVFDVVLLGVGPDGHCASLFPGHPGTQVTEVSVIAVNDSPKPPPTRLSLTFPALDAAREVWFVASGEGKADAVAKGVTGTDRVAVPSCGPRGREHTLWLVDADAASELPA